MVFQSIQHKRDSKLTFMTQTNIKEETRYTINLFVSNLRLYTPKRVIIKTIT